MKKSLRIVFVWAIKTISIFPFLSLSIHTFYQIKGQKGSKYFEIKLLGINFQKSTFPGPIDYGQNLHDILYKFPEGQIHFFSSFFP